MNTRPDNLRQQTYFAIPEMAKDTNTPRWVSICYYLFVLYLPVPVIGLPFIGLSLSAPLFFFVAVYVLSKRLKITYVGHKKWLSLGILIWVGVFLSAIMNGLLSLGANIDRSGAISVIRYLYWLMVFGVVLLYAGSNENTLENTVRAAGVGVLILAIFRLIEAIFLGKIGEYAMPSLFAQNTYGILFSTFSSFFLYFLFSSKIGTKIFALVGNLLIFSAILVNGSRGSWVSVAFGLLFMFFVFILSRPRSLVGLTVFFLLFGSLIFFFILQTPSLYNPIYDQLQTFDNLDNDKSYLTRELMNQKSWRLFQESPVFGVGISRYRVTFIELEIPRLLSGHSEAYFNRVAPHNSYLAFLAETGLFTFMPFLGLLFGLLFTGLRSVFMLLNQKKYWALVILASLVQMSIHMWVFTAIGTTSTWFIYGLVAALIVYGNSSKYQSAFSPENIKK